MYFDDGEDGPGWYAYFDGDDEEPVSVESVGGLTSLDEAVDLEPGGRRRGSSDAPNRGKWAGLAVEVGRCPDGV